MALSALEALERLKDALANGATETPEDGFKTTAQWADESGRSITSVERFLKRCVVQGLVERREYRIRVGKIVRPVAHFRIPDSRNAKGKK